MSNLHLQREDSHPHHCFVTRKISGAEYGSWRLVVVKLVLRGQLEGVQ
jgi:hypothetical protein